jgi:LuxR family transcriptional regulator, maltose regulon positive regulatory protein
MFLIDSSHPATTKLELIADKIVKPSRLTRVSRKRLLDMLQESISSGTSTIISGRAGTGKTTLAVEFAESCGRSVSWYKVDAPDADPQVFFQYLISSIREHRPRFGMQLLEPRLDKADVDHIDELAGAFVYELAECEANPLLVVIEDLHLVSDSEWLIPFFRRMLPLLPSDVHMLITSRGLPPAPFWRMRSKQSLVVIDESTLAFTRAEAIALFESFRLSSEQANIALDHTHGRAAALFEVATFLMKSGTAKLAQS